MDKVDYVVDTTHAYESCVFAGEILPQLKGVPESGPFWEDIQLLIDSLEEFVRFSPDLLPSRCLL